MPKREGRGGGEGPDLGVYLGKMVAERTGLPCRGKEMDPHPLPAEQGLDPILDALPNGEALIPSG